MLNATSIRPAAPLLGVIGLGLTLGALAATEPRFALLAVALLVAPLLVWAPLRISVPLLCVGLGLNFDVVRSGVHVSLPQLIALCVVAAVVVRGLIDANQRTGVWGSAGFLLVFAALPAQLVALDPGAALKGLTQLAVLSVVLFALCVCFASGRVRPERVVPWLLAGVCLSAVFGVYQVVFHVGHPTLVRGGLMRAYATFGQPNAYGQYLAALLPIAITFTHGRAARLGIVAVLVTLLVLTGSRGAWVAAAAGVSVIAYLALRLSVQVTLTATIVAAVFGLLLGRLLARREFPGKSLVETAVLLPLVLPPSVVGYYLLIGLGTRNPLFAWTDISLLFTWQGAAFASAVVGLPLMVQASKAAIASVSPSLENAARVLGAGETEVFFRITLPLARRGIIAGVVLAGARAFGEFGATLMVAGSIPGRTQTVPLAIYDAVQAGRYGDANALVLLTTLLAFASLFVVRRLEHPRAKRKATSEATAEAV